MDAKARAQNSLTLSAWIDCNVDRSALVASGVGLSGVAGYWFASALQCGTHSSQFQQVSCPLASWPMVDYLLLLTTGAVLLAVANVLGNLARVESVASALLIAAGVEFPVLSVFTTLSVVPGIFDPRYLLQAMVVSAGLAGFVASWRARLMRGPSGPPWNRLTLGSAILVLTAWAAYFVPWQFGGNGSVGDCPISSIPCSASVGPLIPGVLVAILVAAGLAVAAPLFVRRLTAVSLFATASTLVVALYVAAHAVLSLSTDSGLESAMLGIGLGAFVGLTGLVPEAWTLYATPTYGPFWSPPGVAQGGLGSNKPG